MINLFAKNTSLNSTQEKISFHKSEVDFASLLENKNLKYLYLYNCDLINIQALKEFNLKELILKECIQKDKIETFEVSVDRLEIVNSTLFFTKAFEFNNSIKSLFFFNNLFNKDCLVEITGMSELENISLIQSLNTKQINLDFLTQLVAVKYLNISCGKIDDLQEYLSLKNLKESLLELKISIPFSSKDIEISEFKLLKKISLDLESTREVTFKNMNNLSNIFISGRGGNINIREGKWNILIMKENKSPLNIYFHVPILLTETGYYYDYEVFHDCILDIVNFQRFQSFENKLELISEK